MPVSGGVGDLLRRSDLHHSNDPFAGRIRENGKIKEYEAVIFRVEDDFGWVTPYGQQKSIFLSSAGVDGDKWKLYRRGDAVHINIGFNYMGPAATLRRNGSGEISS